MRNLTNLSYDDWVDFIFNHPVTPIEFAWHFDEEWDYVCDAEKLIDNMTMLFQNSVPLISKYSMEQIEQGLWFIPGPNGFLWSILSPEVPVEKRYDCINSMAKMFDDLCCQYTSLKTSCYMWWDSVFSYCALGDKDLGNDLEVLEQVAITIAKISHTGCQSAQKSAMHGLEHIVKIFESTRSNEIARILTRHFGAEVLPTE